MTNLSTWAARLEAIGDTALRYGLVAILLYYESPLWNED